jgi:hypothetical protein
VLPGAQAFVGVYTIGGVHIFADTCAFAGARTVGGSSSASPFNATFGGLLREAHRAHRLCSDETGTACRT